MLHARLERIDGTTAVVALGAAHVSVPAQPLAGVALGAHVDLFVRPEELCVAEEDAAAVYGTVAAQIYQGGHVDLHIDVPDAASGRVLLRVSGRDAMARWPAGTRIGIGLASDSAIAFSRA